MNLSLRLATRINDLVIERRATAHVLGLPSRIHSCLQHSMILNSKIRKAQEMGLAGAERVVHQQLIASMERLEQRMKDTSLNSPEPVKAPGVRELYADILAVEEEFGNYTWDHRHSTLYVTIDPVTLCGVLLGPFRIFLKFEHFSHPARADGHLYVEATQPNRSQGHFHPHVGTGGQVCLGDGTHSIIQSLEDGRVLDYFIILKHLLNSYDSSGAYTPLDRWGEEDDEDSVECEDCGFRSEDYAFCSSCDSSYCMDCYRICDNCDEPVCDSCRSVCETCDTTMCQGCLNFSCVVCARPLCGDCATMCCDACGNSMCASCTKSCRGCGTSYCKSCSIEKIGGCECGKPEQCSDCREKCDFCEVRNPGDNYLEQPKEHPEFEGAEAKVFGAPMPGFLPEPAVQEDKEKCETTTA